jgi:hypothetical protein
LSGEHRLIMLMTVIIIIVIMLMVMIMAMLILILMIMLILILMIMVFVDTLVFPVSPWTLRAPDQLVRYLRPSVWLVLCGRTCIL